MSRNLKIVSVITLGLFILSLITYYFNYNVVGPTDSVAFIPNFQMSSISKIVVSGMTDGTTKKVTFIKDGETFLMEEFFNYEASLSVLQDLVFIRIMDLEVTELATTNTALQKELYVAEDDFKGRVELFDKNDNKFLDFYIGDSKNAGTYVRKHGSNEIYIVKNGIYVSSEKLNYIDRSLWQIDQKEIEQIVYTNTKTTFSRKGELDSDFYQGSKKVDEKRFESFLRGITILSFDDFIEFNQNNMPASRTFIEVKTKDKMVYNVALFELSDGYYMMAQELPPPAGDIKTGAASTPEDAKKLNEQMEKERTVQVFNTKHHKYAYKISEYNYKLFTDRNALMTGEK